MNYYSKIIGAIALGLFLPAMASAATVVYTDRATFEAANPGLATEDFENANLISGSTSGFDGTLNSATNNSVFGLGSVIDGFSLYAVAPGDGDAGEVYVGKDFGGVATTVVSSNRFVDDIAIDFSPAVTAVGIDLSGFGGASIVNWTILIGGTIASFSVDVTTPGFFGIATTDGIITSLLLDKPDSGGTVDNLSFGTTGISAVPVPAALPLLVGALGMFGFVRRRTTKAA